MPMSLRDSIYSIGSRMLQKYDDDLHFDVMTYEELQEMQDAILQSIWMLTLENDVYERYLTRHNPNIMRIISNILDRAKFARRITKQHLPKSSRMSFRESIMSLHDIGRPSTPSGTSISSGSRFGTASLLTTKTVGEGSKINIAHRITMANREVDEMRTKLNGFIESSRKRKTNVRAEIEELEIRISEVQEAKEGFEEEVVINGVDPITGKIPAERVTRFIEEWLRSADSIIERLRLKSATIRMHIRKARQQLIQREALGESLRAVDFEQLNIQNQDYVKMIEDKSRYVHDMKKIAGHYHLKLTQHKQKLSGLSHALNSVKKEIVSKRQQIQQLEDEQGDVEVDVEQMNTLLTKLLTFMANHTVPDILDFVKLQAEVEELQRTHKLLNTRRDIQRIIFQSQQKQFQQKTISNIDLRSRQTLRKVSDTIFPVPPIF